MEIGFNAPTTGALIEPVSLRRIITEGEALGFDYPTVSDHIMVPRNLESTYPYSDTGGTADYVSATSRHWRRSVSARSMSGYSRPRSTARSTTCAASVTK